MSFWETKAGHDLAELLERVLVKEYRKKQSTIIVKNELVAKTVETAVADGLFFVSTIPYDKETTLIVLEKRG